MDINRLFHVTLDGFFRKKNLRNALLIVLALFSISSANAQLNLFQEQEVKKIAQSYINNIQRLAKNHYDDNAMDSLANHLFGDASNKQVHNDLKPGETMITFMDYLTGIRLQQGALNFIFKNPKYYYMMNFGNKYGIVEIEKSISGGFQKARKIKAVLVIDVESGQIGEIVTKVPKQALPFGEPPKLKDALVGKSNFNNTNKGKTDKFSKQTERKEKKKDIPLFEMVFIEGGKFIMGNNEGYIDEQPEHEVILNDYYIGKFEVTQQQWETVMGNNPSNFKSKNCSECPVERVSWNDVQEFIIKLNELTKSKYRLPTEAEWEYAAKGGVKTNKYKFVGSNDLNEVAWFKENSFDRGSQHSLYGVNPTGKLRPNELGIYDMNGNVWEWCNDWYDDKQYLSVITNNPTGPSKGDKKVLRGGSWENDAKAMSPTLRSSDKPEYRSRRLGFRLCLDID